MDFDWREFAACRHYPTRLFYPRPEEAAKERRARAICASCVVSSECLEEAYQMGTLGEFGIRAGMGEKKRRALFRKRRREERATVSV